MSAKLRERLPLVEDVLGEREAVLSLNLTSYKNHVYRMVNFGLAFGDLSPAEEEKVIIAGCFHDLGIWNDGTFDYLRPSIALAREYLEQIHKPDWSDQISLMIGEHHKLRRHRGDALTEALRRADLVDISLGVIRFGLDPVFVRDVRARFPNTGFHVGLLRTACSWVLHHPFNPVPVLKW